MGNRRPYEVALRRILEQEERIERQERLIERLNTRGLSARQAEELLALMQTALVALRASLHHFLG